MEQKSTDFASSYLMANQTLEDQNLSNLQHSAFVNFSDNQAQIIGNKFGGAGYFAETHHAASYNVNQSNQSGDDVANLVNSREFGSVDIQTTSGMAFNPKYFSTPEQSYAAGAELFTDESGTLVAKYAGQQIIVPSDQLVQVQQIHQTQIDQAQVNGQIEQVNALNQITFTDRITDTNGVSSTPLSYTEAQQGTSEFRQGMMPEYAQQSSTIDHTVDFMGNALMATAFVSVFELAPAITRTLKQVGSGELQLNNAGATLLKDLKSNQTLTHIQQGAGKAVTAGGLTFVTHIDAGLSAFIVTFTWDVKQIYQRYQNGDINRETMMSAIKQAGLNRGILTLVTVAAVSVAGTVGILVPILAQWLVSNVRERQQFEHGLKDIVNGWMRSVNETAQITARQWQIAYSGHQLAITHQQEQQGKNMNHQQQLNHDIHDFNHTIQNDDFTQEIKTIATNYEPLARDYLQAQNLLIAEQAKSHPELQDCIERFLIENQNNRMVIENAALDAMQLLQYDNQKVTPLSFLDKLKLKVFSQDVLEYQANEPIRTLFTAQLAALRMLKGLQSEQRLSVEFIAFIQSQLHGITDKLLQQEQTRLNDLEQVYQSMSLAYTSLRQRIIQHEARIERLEKHEKLQDWLQLSHIQKIQGLSYKQMPESLRLCTAINEFIHKTEGVWGWKDLEFLQAFLNQVGLEDIDPQDFIQDLYMQSNLKNRLFHQLKKINQKDSFATAQQPSVLLFDELYSNSIHDFSLEQIVNLDNLSLFTTGKQSSAWDLALLILWHLKTAGITPYRLTSIDKQKQNWLAALGQLQQLIDERILSSALQPQINQVKANILTFKLSVPLIGKFSVGKSTLLNTWLEQNIQLTDLGACTSYPTEFHYSEYDKQKVVVVTEQDNINNTHREEYTLDIYQQLLCNGTLEQQNILWVEIHLHNAALARHPDLVIVDTPGLESNVGSHEEALIRYSGTANSSFILCVARTHLGEAERQFVLRQYTMGKPVSLLVCQEDLISSQERLAVRQAIAQQSAIDEEYSLVRGCSAHENDLKGLVDLFNHIEEQKEELFEQSLKHQVQTLIFLAKQNLEQQLATDTSRETLYQQKQAIHDSQQRVREEYEREKVVLLRLVESHIRTEVISTIDTMLNARKPHYYSVAQSGESTLQALIQADVQNTFQLATEQSLYPVIERSAKKLNAAILIHHNTSLVSYLPNIHATDESNANTAMVVGGATGIVASMALGLTLPFLIIPGIFGGMFFAEKRKQEQLRFEIDNVIANVLNNLDQQVAIQLREIAENHIETIYQTLQERLQAESDNIIKIEQQLQRDKDDRNKLKLRVNQVCDSLNTLLSIER